MKCIKCGYDKDLVKGEQCVAAYRHSWAWWNIDEWVVE